ncbi:MAG: multicopper oxidase family protein [Gammaproteobacteria bacterium]
MNRREFLKLGAMAGVGLMSARVLKPVNALATERDTLDVTLVARPFLFRPNASIAFNGLAYNNQVPGPLLRVRYGQRFRARFINHTGTGSTIHWHGMILPNRMDGVPYVTQIPVPNGGEFIYEFKPDPPGFRWYHSHVGAQLPLGLFGAFIVDDPKDEPADVEVVVILHDVPDMHSYRQALAGVSNAPMIAPVGAPELAGMAMPALSMPGMKMTKGSMAGMTTHRGMGDEVAYLARCINGATFPKTAPIEVKIGQTVRLRILNASPTLTHYVRLGGHRLRVTHGDGNRLPRALEVDALRIGVAERYDAWFEVTRPGAWLLQSIADDAMAAEQALRIYTPGMEKAPPTRPPASVADAVYFTYQLAGRAGPLQHPLVYGKIDVQSELKLGGGKWGDPRWTINGATWPDTPKILVKSGDRVLVRFSNPTDMDHPMHLHGHVFKLVEINGQSLRDPLPKDTTLVPGNGGSAAWFFDATSPPGRWVLHCHNSVHLQDGMMTEVRYVNSR